MDSPESLLSGGFNADKEGPVGGNNADPLVEK